MLFGSISNRTFAAGHTVTLELTHNSCYNSCDGKAKPIVTGATGPLTIHWLGNNLPPNTTGDSIVDLCPGRYSVEVIDQSDNTSSGVINFEILNAPPFFWSYSITPISCYKEDDGAITINVSGATPPYSYSWSTSPKDTTNTIDTLVAGTYFVVVTDTNGCVLNDTITINEPDSIRANISITNARCKNICNGTARSITLGGTPPFNYSWSNGDTTALADGLCDGTYDVIITDSEGCMGFDTIMITEPDSLLVTYDVDSVTCKDSCNGMITPVVTGGTSPYSFSYMPGNSSDSILMGACEGLYYSIITDNNGCYVSENITIESETEIGVTDSIGHPTCGMCDGAIKVFPTGGAGKYNYVWNTGNPADTNQLLTGLCSGIYQVAVTDTLGCSKLYEVVLNDSSSLKGLTISVVQPSCGDSLNGSATVIPIGGISPFTYDWQPIGSTDSTVSGLGPGSYTVIVTDSAGCKFSRVISIQAPAPVDFNATINNTSCNSGCDGEIVVNPSGGVPPYSFYWVETMTTSSGITGLCKGWYHLELTDNNGCLFIDSFFVDSTDVIQLSIDSVDASCFGTCDGIAIPQVSGGTPPYSYKWSNGSINDTLVNACAGSYTLEVTDANGCSAISSISILEPTEILANFSVSPAACNFNDGKIFLNPSGGANSYIFKWFNGTDHDSLTGLSAGVYSVEISDTNGCSSTFSIPVPNDNPPDFSIQVNNITCHGTCTGGATVAVNGSQGPYSYAWSTGDSTASISGLCAGKHFVQVIDGYGCIGIKEINVLENSMMAVQFQLIEESCVGSCDGSASAFVSGGVPPYLFNWSVGGNTNAINNLCSGIYTLSVTDSENCTVTQEFEIEGNEELDIQFQRKNLSCSNTCDGELTALVTGGKAPYQFSWSNGAMTAYNPGLCAGNYDVTVTDANGCQHTASIAVGSNTPAINVNINTIEATCGECDGEATLSATGGNGSPYSYFWPDLNISGSSVNSLCAGIYTVIVSDNLGCDQSITVNIDNVGGPVLSDSVVNIDCHGDCDGKAIVTASGDAPFSYFWNDSAMQKTDTAFNLCAGIYSVIVQDSNRCISSTTVSINEPEELRSSFSFTPIACPSDSGSISVSVMGGIGPYSYLWSTSANDTMNTLDSIPSGTYSVIIEDSLGCELFDTVDLLDPNPISISFELSQVLCFSGCDGAITAIPGGGTPPYSYSWNDPMNQIDQRAVGLCSGTYTVIVTDANGCSAVDSVTLSDPASLSLNFVPTNPTCSNSSNGSIQVLPSGGKSPYSYIWSNGQKTNPATGLSAGEYSVIVVDSNGCTAYDTILLTKPTPLTATFNVTNAQCDSANGSIQATPVGGSGNYVFTWNTIPTKTTSFVNDLNAGIYEVNIQDNITSCEVDYSVIVNNTGGPSLTLTTVDESCLGACNGSAMANSPTAIAYFWDDPARQTLTSATGLCSGKYSVTVMDTGGCMTTDTFTINTTQIITSVTNLTKTSCHDACDGEATVSSIGGTAPYSYSWNSNPVQMGAMATGLCPGSYIVTATDSNSCIADASVIITAPDQLTFQLQILAGTVCPGTCTGEAEVIVSGGTPPYSYSWNNAVTTSFNNSLCRGQNYFTITDAKGCIVTDTFEIFRSNPIQINRIISRPLCGASDGSITVTVTGGQGPYTYDWSNGATVSQITGLFAGIYELTVTDALGCTRTETYFVNNPNAPLLNFAENTVDCRGDCNGVAIVTAVGGVAPLSYVWDYVPTSFTDTLKDLCSGVYTVKVTDNLGCIAYGNDTIREPEQLLVNSVIDEQGCGGECIGEASAIPTGGTPPYRYSWNTSPVKTTATATGLCAGNYIITVTDTNDCVSTENLTIAPPPPLIVDSITSKPASCNDNADGEAAVYVSGGTPPYSYFWNDGNITPVIPNTVGALRIVQVTDANGCMIQDTVLVTVEDTVTVEALDDFAACFGQEIELRAIGSGVVSWQWFARTPNSTDLIGNDSIITTILQDTTEFIIRGSNTASPACFDRDTVTVSGIPAPIVDAGPDKTIIRGESTILDDVTPFIPFGFQEWTPGRGLDDSTIIRPRASPLETTTYIITITDEFGCFGSDSITVIVTDREIVYNGFSPNGDGVNDTWTIELIEDFPNAIVEVYNRWGQRVFRSEGYQEKWNGTFEGDPLPDGTYYYVIDVQVQGEKVRTGTITILR